MASAVHPLHKAALFYQQAWETVQDKAVMKTYRAAVLSFEESFRSYLSGSDVDGSEIDFTKMKDRDAQLSAQRKADKIHKAPIAVGPDSEEGYLILSDVRRDLSTFEEAFIAKNRDLDVIALKGAKMAYKKALEDERPHYKIFKDLRKDALSGLSDHTIRKAIQWWLAVPGRSGS
jgi:hypothetical protein